MILYYLSLSSTKNDSITAVLAVARNDDDCATLLKEGFPTNHYSDDDITSAIKTAEKFTLAKGNWKAGIRQKFSVL